jgi:hypothetical protein
MPLIEINAMIEPCLSERICQCDCRRWAHEAWKVCKQEVPEERLVRLYFDDETDPRGVYHRDVCPTCAEHIKFARSRGGESLTTAPPRGTRE